jgi:hypothetical protein
LGLQPSSCLDAGLFYLVLSAAIRTWLTTLPGEFIHEIAWMELAAALTFADQEQKFCAEFFRLKGKYYFGFWYRASKL